MPRHATPPSEPIATYHKPPKFTPAEYSAILRAMDDVAWIRPELYADFKSAYKKMSEYAASLP